MNEIFHTNAIIKIKSTNPNLRHDVTSENTCSDINSQ